MGPTYERLEHQNEMLDRRDSGGRRHGRGRAHGRRSPHLPRVPREPRTLATAFDVRCVPSPRVLSGIPPAQNKPLRAYDPPRSLALRASLAQHLPLRHHGPFLPRLPAERAQPHAFVVGLRASGAPSRSLAIPQAPHAVQRVRPWFPSRASRPPAAPQHVRCDRRGVLFMSALRMLQQHSPRTYHRSIAHPSSTSPHQCTTSVSLS